VKGTLSPSVSILIATCDRRESLLRTLFSIIASDALPDEVIVIDQSAIPIPERGLCPELECRTELRIVRTSPPSLTHARNTGLLHARSEIVLFIDDDV
jgi:hypothetical protein